MKIKDQETTQYRILAELQKFMNENPPKAYVSTVAKEGERIAGYNLTVIV